MSKSNARGSDSDRSGRGTNDWRGQSAGDRGMSASGKGGRSMGRNTMNRTGAKKSQHFDSTKHANRGKPERKDGKKINHFKLVVSSLINYGIQTKDLKNVMGAMAIDSRKTIIDEEIFIKQMKIFLHPEEWDELKAEVKNSYTHFIEESGYQKTISFVKLFERYEAETVKLN